jgi:branched-subunit amino acid transport protein AzlD
MINWGFTFGWIHNTHVYDFGYFGLILTIERVIPKHILQNQMHVCYVHVDPKSMPQSIIEIIVYVHARKMAFAIGFLQYNNPKLWTF